MADTAVLLDGKETSKVLLEKVAREASQFAQGDLPKLVAVLVGHDPASEVYVARKMKVAAQLGLASELLRLPDSIETAQLQAEIQYLNQDPHTHAILVQLPLPKQIDTLAVLQTVAVEKDVDGFHPENLGKLLMGIEPVAMPCTPAGIIYLLDAYKIPMAGKRVAVVGRSIIVGKPITLMLTHRNATVTLCHSKTRDLDGILRESEMIIAAAGQPGLIQADAVQPGAVVVDVGINRLPSGRLVGDVDFEALKVKAGYMTPVPGGVGPMTIAMLMYNTLRLYQYQQGLKVERLLLV